MRLALLWQGAFIDASMHWVGRGPGFQKPLGEPVATLTPDAPLALLDSSATEWPATTDQRNKDPHYKFHGYHLNKQREPAFRYRFGDVSVEDYLTPKSEGELMALVRTLNFSAAKPVDNLYFLAAAGNKIEAGEKGWYEVNGNLRIHIDSPDAPVIRESKGRKELLVPLKLKDKAKVGLEYEW
jgi:hypothetical protein